jgi:hypothetical protein
MIKNQSNSNESEGLKYLMHAGEFWSTYNRRKIELSTLPRSLSYPLWILTANNKIVNLVGEH